MKVFNKGSKQRLLGCALAVALGVGATATYADPINFLPPSTDFKFKFSNDEVLITQSGQSLFGIFNITSITNLTGSVTYWSGNGVTDGTQLVGLFTGLTSTVPGVEGGSSINFTGGQLAIYNVANGSYNPAAAKNSDPAIVANRNALLCGGVACPTAWATANFVPGILDSIGNTTVTLDAALAPTSPATATGNGYLSMAANAFGAGTNNGAFDSNEFTFLTPGNNPADLFLKSDFSACPTATTPGCTSDSWQVISEDPVTARRIPEPGTLMLLGVALLGATAAMRKGMRG